MKFVILLLFSMLAVISGVPFDPDNIVADNEGNLYYNQLIPLSRVRRELQGSYIKAGGVYSPKYGGGGQIVANKNLASGKHYSIDAQAKYSQYGRHKEGWTGINYGLRW